jgi:formyltetrahydrofolate-dependent phosphoribosylglycinamide formyltransferase
MFKKLQQKWKVNSTNLALILCTFAVTGSLTAWISRQITGWLDVDKYGFAWWMLKLGVLLIGYQVLILLIGFCFGQFRFFWNYEKKILKRMGFFGGRHTDSNINIAIFASGTGNNAKKIIEYFAGNQHIKIVLIVCNKPGAGVLQVAADNTINVLLVDKEGFTCGDGYTEALKAKGIDFIVLAGFLWKLPPVLINAYPQRIVNIHPALLPKHGGAGMYGIYVHEAVIAAGDAESGISIHYADELYDHGSIIFQASCKVATGETAASLAQKVHTLEYEHYPKVIEKLLITGFKS